MQRSETEIVAFGEFAHTVLSSETFAAIFKDYTDLSLATIVASEPHELKKREFEYAKLQAVKGFVDHMLNFAQDAAAIKARAEAPQQSDED